MRYIFIPAIPQSSVNVGAYEKSAGIMSLLIFLWALVNLVEMNNTITYAVCSEHYGVGPYAYSHIQEVIRNSSSFHRNVPDFTEKDKARNASSVPGLLSQDAANLVIK